jgi:hypothetical protein
MSIHKTINYKVHVKTANEAQATLHFNMDPSVSLIVEALEATKQDIPPVQDNLRADALKDAQLRYERALKRLDNLAALVYMATIQLPSPGEQQHIPVFVAGVEIGHVNIQAREAWTFA